MMRTLLVTLALAMLACHSCDAPKRAGCRTTTRTHCTMMFIGKVMIPTCRPVPTTRCEVDGCASDKGA